MNDELPFPRPSSTAATAGRQRGQSTGATYRRATGTRADPAPPIRSAIAHDSAENDLLDRGKFRSAAAVPRFPATAHAAPRPRDGSTVPLTPRTLDARVLARGPWPCRDGRAKHHSVPTAQTRRDRPPAASAPAARGPLDSRFAARRPVSPPPAMPPCRSDARRRGRSTHGLRARNAADTCAFRFARPLAHHRRPGATRAPGVRPTAWDEDGFRDGRDGVTKRRHERGGDVIRGSPCLQG